VVLKNSRLPYIFSGAVTIMMNGVNRVVSDGTFLVALEYRIDPSPLYRLDNSAAYLLMAIVRR
jgi:hypothetical protein